MRWVLLLFLLSCDEDIEPKKVSVKIFHSLISQSGSIDWWLAGGLIPESSNYTIFDPLAATSLADSYINLANSGTRDAIVGVAPAHAQGSGWTFNGSTQYLNSQTTCIHEQTIVIWCEDASGVYAIRAWTNSGSVRGVGIDPTSSTDVRFFSGTANTNWNGAANGVIAAISKNQLFRNGNVVTYARSSFTSTALPFFLGAENQNGTAVNFYSGRILRVAIYDTTLSEAQLRALTWTMYNYNSNLTSDSYQATVLASSPIAYYPCNQKIGSILKDYSGNDASGELTVPMTVGVSGNHGLAFSGNGSTGRGRTVTGFSTITGFSMNEFSCAAWIKLTPDVTNQVRIFNIYSNTLTEYAGLEISSGQNLGVFLKQAGVTQNSGNIATCPDGTWAHIVFFNSDTTKRAGIYLNGVKYEFVVTLAGYNDISPDDLYPEFWQDALGDMQHVSFYDHALTQNEVDSLYQ